MKRILLLLVCTVTLGLTSCKKDTIVQQENVLGRTYYLDIRPSDWVRNGNGSYSFKWNTNVINKLAYDSDAVIVYFSHPVDAGTDIALPYTFNDEIASYQLAIGSLSFDMQSKSNIATTPRPSVTIKVKVVIIPSDPG